MTVKSLTTPSVAIPVTTKFQSDGREVRGGQQRTMVDACGACRHESSDVLDGRGVFPEEGESELLHAHCLRCELVTADVVTIGDDGMVVGEILFLRDTEAAVSAFVAGRDWEGSYARKRAPLLAVGPFCG